MTDKQKHYDTLIKRANLYFVQSEEPLFAALQTILLSKAEAFEDAASLFAHHFEGIKTVETMRFESIREHHMSEESTDEQKVKEETES